MVEAQCLKCEKQLLIDPSVTRCFLCGGELEIRQTPQTKNPVQEVITRLAERIVETADFNPQAKRDLKNVLEVEG